MSNSWQKTDSTEKFGIAIANFDGSSVKDGINIIVGRFVHIYEKLDDWFRGCLYDEHHTLGLFPKNIIYLKSCSVICDNGLSEKIKPETDELLLNINHYIPYFIQEIHRTYVDRAKLSEKSSNKTEKKADLHSCQILAVQTSYIRTRDVYDHLSVPPIFQGKKNLLEHHWGCNMRYFDVCGKKFDSLILPTHSASSLYPSSYKGKSSARNDAGNTYNLFIKKISSLITNSIRIQIVIGVFSIKNNEYISELIVTDNALNPNIKLCGIIQNLPKDDKDQFLLIKIFRIGNLLSEKTDLNSQEVRRPFMYGALELKPLLETLEKGREIKISLYPCSDAEYCLLEGKRLKEIVNDSLIEEHITFEMKIFFGPVEEISNIPDIKSIQDVEIVKALSKEQFQRSSNSDLSEIYIHLKKMDLEKIEKGHQGSYKVRIVVFGGSKLLKECIYYGSSNPKDEYNSPVLYHNNSPVFNDLVKISTCEDISKMEIHFYVYHVPKSKSTTRKKTDIAFSFFTPISNHSKFLTRPNDIHTLVAHKIESIDFHNKNYLKNLNFEYSSVVNDDKTKPFEDYLQIRSHIATENYTCEASIADLLNLDYENISQYSKLIPIVDLKPLGAERCKFCLRLLSSVWNLLENNITLPEIYIFTLNRFKDLKTSNYQKEIIIPYFQSIQNVDVFYEYFMRHMNDYFTLKEGKIQQTLKSMDLLLLLLSELVKKSTTITSSKFSKDVFNLLYSFNLTNSNTDQQAHSSYGNELPTILQSASDVLSFKQQTDLVEKYCSFQINDRWSLLMKLFFHIIDMPLFQDIESHNRICTQVALVISAIHNSKTVHCFKAFYLSTQTTIKLFEGHSLFLQNTKSEEDVKFINSLFLHLTELFHLTYQTPKLDREIIIQTMVCLLSYTKLITPNIFGEICVLRDLMSVATALSNTFQDIFKFSNIPSNYRFHWGYVFNEISRIISMLVCRILSDCKNNKPRTNCINVVINCTISFIIAIENHLGYFIPVIVDDFITAYGNISLKSLNFISELYYISDSKGSEVNWLRELLKICLLQNIELSSSSILVFLKAVKRKFDLISNQEENEKYIGQIVSVIDTTACENDWVTNKHMYQFIERYKKISETFWNSAEGKSEYGKKLMQISCENLLHIQEQRTLPNVVQSPFLTLYLTFKNVIHEMKKGGSGSASMLRYIGMLLELKYYQEAGFAMIFLAENLSWDDKMVEEVRLSTQIADSNWVKSPTSDDAELPDSSAQLLDPHIPSTGCIELPNYLPEQISKIRKLIYLKYAANFLLTSTNHLAAAPVLRCLVNQYESSKSSFYNSLISSLYNQLSIIYSEADDCRSIRDTYFFVAFYGNLAPEKIKNLEFIYCCKIGTPLAEIQRNMIIEFPEAKIFNRSVMNEETSKSSPEFHIRLEKAEMYVDDQDAPSPGMNNQMCNKFCVDLPKKFDTKFFVNDHSKYSKTRKIFTTEYPFPCHLKMSEVTSRNDYELTPIEVATETISKTTKKLCGLAPYKISNDLMMLINGIVDAAVNGGPKLYVQAFLVAKYLEAYPDDVTKVENLKSSLKEQMNQVKLALEYLLKIPSGSNRPLIENMRRMYNEMSDYYNGVISIGCVRISVATPVTAIQENESTSRSRSNSILANIGHVLTGSNNTSSFNSAYSSSENASISTSPQEALFSSTGSSMNSKQNDKLSNTKRFHLNFGSLRRNKPAPATTRNIGAQTLRPSSSLNSQLVSEVSTESREDSSKPLSESSPGTHVQTDSGCPISTSSSSSTDARPSSLKKLFSKQ